MCVCVCVCVCVGKGYWWNFAGVGVTEEIDGGSFAARVCVMEEIDGGCGRRD